jgi:hypothetical protein
MGLIGAPTYGMLHDATQRALLEVLDANQIPHELLKSENVLVLRDTGSRILLRSMEEYERLRGTNLAWFGIDELTYCHEEAWLRLEGRLRDPKAARLCGYAVWTPKGRDWVWRRFLASGHGDCDVTVAKPMENRHILEKVPDFYERLRRSYDDVFFRQEVLGEYLNTSEGRVYHAFDAETHVRPLALDTSAPLLWALDFNVDPMCSVLAQRLGDTIHVIGEIVLHRASTYEACEEFRNRFPDPNLDVRVYADAAGAHRQTTGLGDHEIVRDYLSRAGYRKATCHFDRSNPAVRDRVAQVNGKLRSAAGYAELYVDPACKELIKDFEEVLYKEGSGVIDKRRESSRTHLSDALGYLVWQEFGIKRQSGEQKRRLL